MNYAANVNVITVCAPGNLTLSAANASHE